MAEPEDDPAVDAFYAAWRGSAHAIPIFLMTK
jgi:hypothetical protein